MFRVVESVTEGQPDKICDKIADAILDEYLKQDPNTKAGIEVFGGSGLLLLGGEVSSKAKIDPEYIAKQAYREIGYEDELEVLQHIQKQEESPPPNLPPSTPLVNRTQQGGGKRVSQGKDQGVLYGFATNKTEEFLPKPAVCVNKLAERLDFLRKNHPQFGWLRPHAKIQLAFLKDEIKTISLAIVQSEAQENCKELLISHAIEPVLGDVKKAEIIINSAICGKSGGFEKKSGLTGRKLAGDTYCGLIPHNGGAFSGKDGSKLDRCGAYMARFVAKNLVANELAGSCFVSVAYAPGSEDPIMIRAVGDGKDLSKIAKEKFDFRPQSILGQLDLKKPLFFKTSNYGHFGKDDLPWEQIIEL